MEIAIIDWDGPEAPTYPRFPVTNGLNGAAVSSKRAVIVRDVASDPRYLTTIGGTRGEMIQPVIYQRGVVVGTIDVESDRAIVSVTSANLMTAPNAYFTASWASRS